MGPIPVKEVNGKSGRLILVEEEGDGSAVERFNAEMGAGRKGLVISTVHPDKLTPRLDGGEARWLSRARSDMALNPTRLDYDIYQHVSKFYKNESGTFLLLGLEYLCLVNGFKGVARFIKKVGDKASSSDGAFLVGLNPMAFDEKEVAVLERAFDYVERRTVGARVVRRIAKGEERPGWSYLVLDKEEFKGLRRSREKGICLTTVQPEKIRRWEDFKGEVLWISESGKKGAYHPSKLAFEVRQSMNRSAAEGNDVFIDGLEHLMIYTGLSDVIDLLKSVSDTCAQAGGTLVASLDPRTLERKDLALFKKMFDMIIG